MLMRGVLPAGFMPDANAAAQGRLELTFCSPAGNTLTMFVSTSDEQSDATMAADCPFGVFAAAATLPPSTDPVPGQWAVVATLIPTAYGTSLPALPARGPPLGSRAPPPVL